MKGKRGISQIVTTILIILLSLAAIVIVWQAVLPLFKQPGVTADCLTLSLDVDSVTKSTLSTTIGTCSAPVCLTKVTCESAPCNGVWTWATNADGKITVKRNTGTGDLKAIKLLINGVTVKDAEPATTLAELETQDISALTIKTGDKIKIAPIVGDNNLVCGTVSTYTA